LYAAADRHGDAGEDVAGTRNRVGEVCRTDDREEEAMTNPMSQAEAPPGAAAAENATADDSVTDVTRDSDGVPVGQADVEADARRAEEDNEPDRGFTPDKVTWAHRAVTAAMLARRS
jgi:hypothetical protein